MAALVSVIGYLVVALRRARSATAPTTIRAVLDFPREPPESWRTFVDSRIDDKLRAMESVLILRLGQMRADIRQDVSEQVHELETALAVREERDKAAEARAVRLEGKIDTIMERIHRRITDGPA